MGVARQAEWASSASREGEPEAGAAVAAGTEE